MPTWNKELHSLTEDDVNKISQRFLMGWHDFIADGHTFRLKGFNHIRENMGLEPLNKDMSLDYRIRYVKSHYSVDEIISTIDSYLQNNLVADTRWTGIELFDCRFGREYVKAFKMLIGASTWRKLSERTRKQKSFDTQIAEYGGIGVAGQGTYDKMIQTKSAVTYQQLIDFRKGSELDSSFFESIAEEIVFYKLVDKFGKDDVYYQYGIHPADSRYPYPCDFYIKSLDLFIELNVHYSHHTHWYDPNNKDDRLRVTQFQKQSKPKYHKNLITWCKHDIEKRDKAKQSGINYLVFWDGKYLHDDKYVNGKLVRNYTPRLADFYEWFYDYNCDYKKFLQDYPGNTY